MNKPAVNRQGLQRSAFLLPVFLVHLIEEFFHREIVDGQKPAEAFDGDICPSFFYSPVLHTGQVVIVSKIFVTAITFCLSQDSKFRTNANEGIT